MPENISFIKLLIIEDNPADANLLMRELAKLTCKYEYKITDKKELYLKYLHEFEPDVIISDFNIPFFEGFESLEIAKAYDKNIPFIYLSGTIGEEKAIDAMLRGAEDCIMKDQIKRLIPAIEREIEQAKNQKKHLKEHEELKLFQRIFSHSYDATAIYNRMEGLVYFNNAFKNQMESLQEEIKKDFFLAINRSENDNQFIEAIEKGLFKEELIVIKENGDKVYIDQQIFSFFDEIKRTTYYVIIKRDITDKKESEQMLIKAKERAEESDKMKTSFIANISHEIRTPLNAIIGFTSLLNSQTNREKQNEFTSIIQNSSEQLLKIVEDILELSRIESKQIIIKEECLEINSLIDEVFDYYSFYMGQQNPNIKLIHSKGQNDEDTYVFCDPIRVKQVLNYLITNAFKFTEKGEISFGYRFDNDYLLFYVIDSGIGISEESSQHIFERFRKAQDSNEKLYSGTGLGLSISKEIVELMGGSIWVKSALGEGSQFYFNIPLKKQAVEIKNNNSPDQFDFNGKTILVAEDDEMNYFLISEYIKALGCNCLHARDGKEVLSILKNNKNIDLIFMDIKMPVMDGIEAFQRIREMKITIPVIAQTAFTLDNEKERVMKLGFNDYISKPISRKLIMTKIAQLLK